MEEKLTLLYKFLKKNRKYNHELKEKGYKNTILWHDKNDRAQKVISMLYRAANTQSQPKIDKLSKFFQFIIKHEKSLNSFGTFIELIGNKKKPLYKNLYDGLKQQPGWGPKTSALFVKNIYHTHNSKFDPKLLIWSDAPKKIAETDQIFLPVDRVIIEIFTKIENRKWSFPSINTCISKYYSGDQIEVWDDLWFWGFITQRTVNKKRVFGWNSDKYWALRNSNKNAKRIRKIQELSQEFIDICSRPSSSEAVTRGHLRSDRQI